ncbi:MAG: hypothetical protein KAW17_09705 [Candidatus Eisenbacteria sp.]|nr:hypothetical protein [Candidatus Eisenbacteria bacterium]
MRRLRWLTQTALARQRRAADLSHTKVLRMYPGRVERRNRANMTLDIGLFLGGRLQNVPVAQNEASMTSGGTLLLPRVGALVLIVFAMGHGSQPLVVGSFSEPIPEENRLLPLFREEDVDEGTTVARIEPAPALDLTWRTLESEPPELDPEDIELRVHPSGNIVRTDGRGHWGHELEGDLAYILRNGGGFMVRQELRTGREDDGPTQFEFLVTPETGKVLFTLDPAPNGDETKANLLFRAHRGILLSTIEEDEFPEDDAQERLLIRSTEGVGIRAGTVSSSDIPDGGGNILIQSELDTKVEASVAIEIDAGTSVSVDAGTSVDVDAGTKVDVDAGTEVAVTANTKVGVTAGLNMDLKALAGDVDVQAVLGDIDIHADAAGDVSLRCSGGGTATLRSDCSGADGDILIEAGEIRIHVDPATGTRSGDIDLKTDHGISRQIELVSDGRVRVESEGGGGTLPATVLIKGATLIEVKSASVRLGQGSFYRLIDERFKALYNTHVHTGVQSGSSSTGVPASLVGDTHMTSQTKAS